MDFDKAALDRWITRIPDYPDCRCPEWNEGECCGGCDGDAGDCGCDENKYYALIDEAHHECCPTAIAARAHRKSTLCLCKNLYSAEKDAEIEAEDRKREKGE